MFCTAFQSQILQRSKKEKKNLDYILLPPGHEDSEYVLKVHFSECERNGNAKWHHNFLWQGGAKRPIKIAGIATLKEFDENPTFCDPYTVLITLSNFSLHILPNASGLAIFFQTFMPHNLLGNLD
jgi:hypothetical protein